MCEEKRESLSTVLSYLCAFGDNNATGLINDVIEDVASRKGVKRAIQDLAGEETYARYIESLRVPDWVLLFFKTRGRISGHTWQTVISITQLGRTGVSKVFYSFILCLFNNFFSRIFYLNKLRVALPVALRVAACRLGPVSRKPRKVFGPVKPFLVHFYLKTLETSCMKGNFLPVMNM